MRCRPRDNDLARFHGTRFTANPSSGALSFTLIWTKASGKLTPVCLAETTPSEPWQAVHSHRKAW